MSIQHRCFIPAVFALLVAGCASPQTTGPNAFGILPPGPATTAGSLRSSLVIHIPKRKRGLRGKHPEYVSASTQSAQAAIAPASGCTTCSPKLTDDIALAPSSPGCTATATGTTCVVELDLAPGTYTGSFTTYDGPLNAQKKPTGSILSLDKSFPMLVAIGKSNTTRISLDGVPHNLSYLVLTGSTLDFPPPQVDLYPTFFIAAGAKSAQFEVFPIDADNNVIAGPGTPAISAAGSSGFVATAAGNVISVTPPATYAKGFATLTVTLKGAGCAVSAATCSFIVEFSFDSIAAVANAGNNSVVVWPNLALTTGAGAPYATITKGVNNPAAVLFDMSIASNGNLFVANAGNDSVTMYSPPYTSAPAVTMTNQVHQPAVLAIDFDGDLAVANANSDTVEVFSPPYTGTPVIIPLENAFRRATSLAFDGSQNLWIAEVTGNVVREYTKASNFSSNPNTLDGSNNLIDEPSAIALDVDSNLYVAEEGTQEIDKWTLLSNYTGHPGATQTGLAGITALTLDHQGQGDNLALCFSGGLYVYDIGTFTLNSYNPATATCVPGFSRTDDLLALFPGSSTIWGYPNTNQTSEYWHTHTTFTSETMHSPTSLAEWP